MRLSLLLLLAVAICSPADSDKRPRHTSDYTLGPSIQPLVIYGEGWSQQFTIINVDYYNGGERTIGTLRFYTQGGEPWRIPLVGRGATEQIPVNLASGQMLMIETEVSQQPQQLGWLHFDTSFTSGSSGIYHAFTTFRKQTPGRADLMTNAPFADDIKNELIIPFDNRDGKYPGIGLVNTRGRSTAIVLNVYDAGGTLQKSIAKQVGAMSLVWFSLVAENGDLNGMTGQIKARPTSGYIGAFTLQFTPNGAFTALPVVHTYGLP